jgi:nicotinate dehydrogenase subunit B
MNAPTLSRRAFAAGLGGITVAFSFAPRVVLAQAPARLPGSLQNNRMLDAWLSINADGSATVFTGKVELGQGAVTALAQIAADELDLPLGRITMVSGDTARTPEEGFTSGSLSIESSGTALRLAGAEVRAILIEFAAKQLGVPPEGLSVSDGVISAPDGRKLGYGEIAAAARGERQGRAQISGRPQDRRQVGAAARHPGQSDRGRRLCAGSTAAGHAARPDRAAATLRRQA